MTIEKAFNDFMAAEFESAVDKSTESSWGGGSYSVELFPDGSYRVAPSDNFGNLYFTPGVILTIPTLGDEEWDEDPDLRYYDNAEQAMRDF